MMCWQGADMTSAGIAHEAWFGNGERGAVDDSGPAHAAATGAERRGGTRERVIKAAKILFGGAVVDCVVLDVSERGARVRTGTIVPVPPEVVLRFRSGAAYRARRLWTRGTQIGLEYQAGAPLDAEAGLVALSALEALPPDGLGAAVRILGDAAFLDDVALRRAALEAEAAYAALRDALRRRLDTGQRPATAG
jgi:hypothetical protein